MILGQNESVISTRIWEIGEIEEKKMYELGRAHKDAAFYMKIAMTRPPETIANIAICLLKQTDYLLFKLLESLEKQFLAEGGMRERMTRLRIEERKKQKSNNNSNKSSSDQTLKP